MPVLTPPAEQKLQFLFADHLVLDDSPTRDFYRHLLRGLTHKNNNLLAVVHGFSSLILMNEVSEDVAENVKQMRDSAQHSSELGERILTASGCARISPQDLNLADYLPHLQSRLGTLCANAGVSLRVVTSPDAPPIIADSAKLKDILAELVRNAAEAAAADPAGFVEMEVLPRGLMSPLEDRRVDILVRNNGTLIPEDRLGEVYEPFFTTKGSNHFGIGLTMIGVLAGQMKMRFGIASADGFTAAWLSCPIA